MTNPPARRTVLGTGAAAALLVGCSKYGDSGGSSQASASPAASAPTSGAAGGAELASTSDIPVGGGKIFKDRKVVVTQPTKGEFKAFSAICTHQGCTVSTVADGTIDCPCHGSKYRITDASVVAGPAPRPLPAERITVEGNSIRLA
ncbi:Rieske (2Fe-2S) protein [Streptomyces sp. NBC_01571]|uniref:Rieske (2Fe-2S) protein n=1 Tax=Streptomyces sp. NBC_01571 TaxID=2975883 RepID=UPI002258121B|nr:Rieske (2Fe-2S) protein [Streptomyces sp. NBC_01571]MCX4574036.1 Rieske (2Fe-2S) protein [Streptomyces sp. NBC_01571]